MSETTKVKIMKKKRDAVGLQTHLALCPPSFLDDSCNGPSFRNSLRCDGIVKVLLAEEPEAFCAPADAALFDFDFVFLFLAFTFRSTTSLILSSMHPIPSAERAASSSSTWKNRKKKKIERQCYENETRNLNKDAPVSWISENISSLISVSLTLSPSQHCFLDFLAVRLLVTQKMPSTYTLPLKSMFSSVRHSQ
jgi:hypothetical protein